MENNIKCKKDGSDQLEPFLVQCHEIIYKTEAFGPQGFIGFLILICIVVILFCIGHLAIVQKNYLSLVAMDYSSA